MPLLQRAWDVETYHWVVQIAQLGMKQVGQTNRRNLHNSRNFQIVQLLVTGMKQVGTHLRKLHNFRHFLP
jgi:hypothetical protein